MAEVKKSNVYIWEGLDKSRKRVKGEITGQSESLVKAMLRRKGINPTKVKAKPKSIFSNAKTKVTPKEITVFSRQLSTMMTSGVPLVQAFEIIGNGHENLGMQQLILTVKEDVEAGNSLTDSLGKHPLHFNDLYCNLVKAGEHAGILEGILDKLSVYLEKTEALKSKIKSALFYPTAVLVCASVVVSILMIFVIPQFSELFGSFGADLPALTQFLIDCSNFFVANWLLIFGGAGTIIIGAIQIKKRSTKVQHFLERASLKLPIIGKIIEKAAIARFARTLETMFAAGTPLVEAMDSVAGACGNVVFFDATMRMKDEVATGGQLQSAMKDTNLFPNMVIQMIAIGEESGEIDAMLGKVADWFEQEVDDAVEGLTSLLEPAIMAFLGIVIGGIVVGMYLPIFKMGAVV